MDDFDKIIKEIKIYRSPEAFLDDIFMNLTEYIHDDYPNFTFYKKENDLLFEYNSKIERIYYNYKKIYLILKEKYCCNDVKITELIIHKMEEYLKLRVKTVLYGLERQPEKMEEYLKLRVKTVRDIEDIRSI